MRIFPQLGRLVDFEMRNVDGQMRAAADFQCFFYRFEQFVAFVAHVTGIDAAMRGNSLGNGHEFVGVGIGPRHVLQTSGHTPHSVCHGLVGQVSHLLQLRVRRRAAVASHDLVSHAAVRQEVRDINANALGFERVVIFRSVHRTTSAIARHQRCATLRQVARGPFGSLGQQRAVAVVVQVNEAGTDDLALAIDSLADVADVEFANGHDLPFANGNAAVTSLVAAAVNDTAVGKQEIGIDGFGQDNWLNCDQEQECETAVED